MDKQCVQCSQEFSIRNWDRNFYAKIDVPEPLLCPDCRAQRRMMFRNEKSLYRRNCGLCKRQIIALYSEEKPFPVYCQDCYWSDQWDGLALGSDYDANIPFFTQVKRLLEHAPRLAIINTLSENSEYCNYSSSNKNCYLSLGNFYEQDCMYGRYSTKNNDCYDYLWLYGCELCYESIFTKNCFQSFYLDRCEDCRDCRFSVDLKGCSNCLFCANLRHKDFYILNKRYSKDEYFEKLSSFNLDSFSEFTKARKFFFSEFRLKFPFRSVYQVNSEDCVGDNHENCKNLYQSFDCTSCEDSAYVSQTDEVYSSMDMTCNGYERSELLYQTTGCTAIFNCIGIDCCWNSNDLAYSAFCFNSHDCFGCVSLQRKEYCILNRQYRKEEYIKLRSEIIQRMKNDGVWGEFFPADLSPFGYNETIAIEYFPLTKGEIETRKWKWKSDEDKTHQPQQIPFPEKTSEIDEKICDSLLVCTNCSKNYRIMKPEFSFYKKLELPIPRECPNCRLALRMKRRNPRKLYDRSCSNCGSAMQTGFAPEQPEKVFCESCFVQNLN